MDLLNLGEFHCAVCFELFDEGSKSPRMLSCGHTFCNSCLENLLVQSPVCPNCSKDIQYSGIDDIPVNYVVKSFLSQLNINKSEVPTEENYEQKLGQMEQSSNISITNPENKTKGLPSEGYCEDHKSYKHLRCMDCESWICGICATLLHKSCQTLLVSEALKKMKHKISQDVKDEIEAQNFQNKSLDISIKYLTEKRLTLNKEIKIIQLDLRKKVETFESFGKDIEKLELLKSERNMQCAKIKAFETSMAESVNNDQFLKATNKLNEFLTQTRKLLDDSAFSRDFHCPLSLEALKELCLEGSVYASHCENESNLYGKVEVKGNRVWVHGFKPQTPKLKYEIVSLTELLISFGGSSEFPRRGFIQVNDGTGIVSDVVISTDALTPRAMNFLLLCSGIKGRSYKKISLLRNSRWSIRTPFFKGGAVVEGISDGGVYEAPSKKGIVYGQWAENTNSLSGFYILMEDDPEVKLGTKFGFVDEGFEVCERIYCNKKDGVIKRCGLVI